LSRALPTGDHVSVTYYTHGLRNEMHFRRQRNVSHMSTLTKQEDQIFLFALLNREKEAARYALMLDPLTAAVCSPAEKSALFDEMWEAQLPYLQYFERQ
jgi:alpha-galactosidase/6-phospho-beta-glucosidase family protein